MAYATISDLRDEGVPASISDAQVQKALDRATKFVDMYTGRFFEPRDKTFKMDGSKTRTIFLMHPIITINSVSIDGVTMPTEGLVIYNRHLTQELLEPDDRDNPKIELVQLRRVFIGYLVGERDEVVFPGGQQNIEIDGRFGYTDPDGSPDGVTPELIAHATKLIALRELPKMYSEKDERDDERGGYRVRSLKTRDQSISFASPSSLGRRGVGAFTGDPEIDDVLMQYRRPPRVGSV